MEDLEEGKRDDFHRRELKRKSEHCEEEGEEGGRNGKTKKHKHDKKDKVVALPCLYSVKYVLYIRNNFLRIF